MNEFKEEVVNMTDQELSDALNMGEAYSKDDYNIMLKEAKKRNFESISKQPTSQTYKEESFSTYDKNIDQKSAEGYKVANILKILAIIQLICGVICLLAVEQIGYVFLITSIVIAILLWGISAVIILLSSINEKLDN